MIALITGASKGLGKSIATYFASRDYDLILLARNFDALIEIKGEFEKKYNNKTYVYDVDVADKEHLFSTLNKINKSFQVIDVLVNNVGIYQPDEIQTENEEFFELTLNVNLKAAYYLTQNLLPKILKSNTKHIFNICSVLSKDVRTGAASYTISKHALKGFNDVLREELRDNKVKVTAIYPGSINTSSWEGIIAPVNEFVQPEDIVNCIDASLKTSKNANIEEIVIKPLNKNY
jgi:short-subunit dehydrogenase